ncbi:MAG: competence protein CoiA family protein [Alkalibacterium sp.]|uniref:competence protein CoiA n=1 Tax=Alkalibacterium sp. TaxID=1872447 RepID=UPI003970C2D6
MFIAIDKQCNIIKASDYNYNEECFCPACKEEVIFKNGSIYQSHFSHRNNSNCKTFSEGETEEHMEGKLLLYNWFKKEKIEVQLEAFLPALKQRPDLLINYKGINIAIEYQCSPISKEMITSRTRGYKRNGYYVFWILGPKLKVSEKFNTIHFTYISMDSNERFYLFQLDQKRKKLEMLSDFSGSHSKIHYTKKSLTFSSTLKDIFRTPGKKERTGQFVVKNKKEQKEYLYQLSFYKYEKSRHFFELMYESGVSIESLPNTIFYIVPNEWMIATFSYQWKFLMLVWLGNFESYHVITTNVMVRKIKEWENEKELVFQGMPNVNAAYLNQPFFEYIEKLCANEVMKKVGDEKWIRHKNIFRE